MRVYRFLAVLLIALCLGVALHSTSLLHVDTDTWASVTSQFSTAHNGAATVLMSDGRVLISGGESPEGAATNVAEFLNVDGSISPAPSMNIARTEHAAVALPGGDVLVTGGRDGQGYTNSAELYDASAGKWTTLNDTIGDGRADHAMAVLPDGNVVIAGGQNSYGAVSSVAIYDASTQRLSQVANLITPRVGAAIAAMPNGKVLIAGGLDTNGTALASTEIFSYNSDTGSGTIASGPSMVSARAYASATSTYDGVAIVGGNDGSSDLGSAEIFNQWKSTFRTVSGATPRSHHLAMLLPGNGSVLVTGGTAGTTTELLQPWRNSTAGQFVPAAPSTINHAGGFAAPTHGTGVALVGGGSASATSAEFYGFATIKTDKDDYAPGTTVVMTGAGFQAGEQVALHMHQWVGQSVTDYPDYTVTADSNGNFVYDGYAPTVADLYSRYHLTAVGLTSGIQAQNVFTDALNLNLYAVANGACSTTTATSVSAGTQVCANASGLGNNNAAFCWYNGNTVVQKDLVAGNGNASDIYSPATAGTWTVFGAAISGSTYTCPNSAPTSGSDRQSLTVTASKSNPTLSITNSPVTYNGSTQAATVVGSVPGTVSNVKYNGSSTVPTNAATYTVTADFVPTDTSHYSTLTGASAGNFVINQATPTVNVSWTGGAYTGSSYPANGSVSGVGSPAEDLGSPTFAYYSGSTATGTPLSGAPANVGTYTVRASYAGSTNYKAASSDATISIGKTNQTITFASLSSRTFGDADFQVSAIASSNLPVSFSVGAGDQCTINGNIVHITAAGSCTVTATQSGDSNYNAATAVPQTFSISKKTATVTLSGLSYTYDTTAKSATVSTTPSGLNVTITYNGSTTPPTNAGNYAVVATISDNNYSGTASGTLVIAQGTPTATFAGAPATASFGSQFQVAVSSNSSATPTITATGVCSISGSTVTMTSGTGVCSLEADWPADLNFKAVTRTQSTTAQQAIATITVADATFMYDGTPKAVSPIVTPAIAPLVTYTGVAPTEYQSSSTPPTDPGTYTATATVDTANYIGQATGKLTINKRTATLALSRESGASNPSSYGSLVKFYLAMDKTPTCPTGTVDFYVDYVDSESVPAFSKTLDGTNCSDPVLFQTATLTPTDADQHHTITAKYSGDKFFGAGVSNGVSHDVSPDATNVTLTVAGTKVYVGDTVTFHATVALVKPVETGTVGLSGKVLFNEVTVDADNNVTGTVRSLGEVSLPANSPYDVTFNTSSLGANTHYVQAVFQNASGYYSGSSSAVGVQEVDRITPVILWNPTTKSMTYGTPLGVDELNATAVDSHNLQGDGTPTPIEGTFVYDSKSGDVLPVDDAKVITVTFTPKNADMFETQTATMTFKIVPATLTVTADDKNRIYGQDNPELTFKYAGFVNKQDASVITKTAVCATLATKSSDAGTYDITCSGAEAPNYTFNYVKGTLTVGKAPAAVVADAKSKTYGDANPQLTATVSGAVGTDVLNYTLATTAMQSSGVGNYPITVTLGSNPNYEITKTDGTLTIGARAITVTAVPKSKVYGDIDPALTYQVTSGSLVAGDGFTGSLTRAAGENVGSYGISQGTLVLNANYALTYAGANLIITPANLTITADSKTMTLNGSVPPLTYTPSGFKYQDTSAVLSGAPVLATVASSNSGIGSYPISIVLGSLTATNYTFTLVPSTLQVQYAYGCGRQILQPIDLTGVSVFPKKQGSTVPAKFQVCNAAGVSIGTAGVVTDFRVVKVVSGTITSTPNEVVDSTTPDTAFRWDGQEWIYNISTKNYNAGSTYYFLITLNDGTSIPFQFGLK